MSRAAVDDMIRRLLLQDARGGSRQTTQQQLAEGEIRSLCGAANEVLMRQANLLELDAPLNICGDVHGHRAVLGKLEALYEIKKRPIISWIKYIILKKITSIRRRI